MKCNIGNKDRMFRIVLGLTIIAVGLLFESWLGLIGVVMLVTGIIRWCPAYIPFSISTKK